jgi:hypothetical protein
LGRTLRVESSAGHLELFDAYHAESEDRFVAIGPIASGLIVVVYTETEDDVVRIIRARERAGIARWPIDGRAYGLTSMMNSCTPPLSE